MFPYADKYISANVTVLAGSTYTAPANEVDVGALLKAKYGTTREIPGFSGFIVSSLAISLKFNSTDNDVIEFDTSLMGNVWTFAREDLLVNKIFFAKAASPAVAAEVQVVMIGSPEILHA